MVRRTLRFSLVLVGLMGTVAGAQQPPSAPPGQAPSGVIAGVLQTDLGQPVRKATVTVNSTSPRFTRTAASDGDGRFQLTGLPAGEFKLWADKPGFLSMVLGARRAGTNQTGTPITLAAGQKIDNVRLVMPRGSVITGVVTDEFGDPAFNIPVRAMRFVNDNGRKSLTTGGNGTTDDRGVYRVAGLMPGEYLVSATPRDTVASAAAQAEALRDRMSQINAARGPGEAMPPPPPPSPAGYVSIFYPGTPSGGSASAVRVGATEEISAIDIKLQMIHTATISGTITAEGPMPQTRLQLIETSLPINGVGIWFRDMRPDGSFAFHGLVPGAYVLKGFGTPGGQPGVAGGEMWGSVDVVADPRNTSPVTLSMKRGVTVSGSVVLASLPAGTDVARLRVSLQPVSLGAEWEMAPFQATPEASGAFRMDKVLPGRYRPAVSGLPEGWAIASAVFEDRDIADVHLTIDGSRNVAGGEVKFVARTAEVSGVVTAPQGARPPDYTVLIFPQDARLWLPQSRRILVTRPGADGRYSIKGLPPGEYRVVPVFDAEAGQWWIGEFLTQLVGVATRFTVGEGERLSLDLRAR